MSACLCLLPGPPRQSVYELQRGVLSLCACAPPPTRACRMHTPGLYPRYWAPRSFLLGTRLALPLSGRCRNCQTHRHMWRTERRPGHAWEDPPGFQEKLPLLLLSSGRSETTRRTEDVLSFSCLEGLVLSGALHQSSQLVRTPCRHLYRRVYTSHTERDVRDMRTST